MARADALLMDALEYGVAPLVRAWMMSLQWRIVGGYRDPQAHRFGGPCLWAFWHSQLLFPAYIGRDRDIRILISRHRDGEIVARVAKGLGLVPVRGSSGRGGAEALVELVNTAGKYDVAITPDGPRGPAEVVQPGVIILSQMTGRPIIPVAATAWPRRRLGSWDRFVVPMPGARASITIGRILRVPADADKDEREVWRLRLEDELKECTARVERVARLPRCERAWPLHHHRYSNYDRPLFTPDELAYYDPGGPAGGERGDA